MTRASSCWVRTSASTAACFARPRDCRRASASDRVQDTPLAEATIAGMSVGMATHGLKPVAEIQFMGFIYPALDQIVNHMSRMRYRTRGRLTCPVVIRMPHGGGIHAPEHHSESTETLLCHIPGIRVVCPSSPARAYGLLLAAIRDPDPVMFLEPARLYRAMRQEVTDDGRALPLDRCFMLREGSDVTLVTWGAMTVETLRAASRARRAAGISAEVIDLATLSPIDSETILASVAKTGRLVIVHEAARNVGRRRRDRGHRRRARAVRSHRAHPARRGLRHRDAAVQARARLHSRRATHRRRGATHVGRTRASASWAHSGFRIWARDLAEAEILAWHVQARRPGARRSADGLGGDGEIRGRGAGSLQRHRHGAARRGRRHHRDRRAAHRFRFRHRGRQHAGRRTDEELVESVRSRRRRAATARPAAARCPWRARWRATWGSISAASRGSGARRRRSRSTTCWPMRTRARSPARCRGTARSRRRRRPNCRPAQPGSRCAAPRRAMARSMYAVARRGAAATVCDDADIHAWRNARRLHAAADARAHRRLARRARAERLVRCGLRLARPARAHRSGDRRRYAAGLDRAGGDAISRTRRRRSCAPPSPRTRAPPISAASRRRTCAASL